MIERADVVSVGAGFPGLLQQFAPQPGIRAFPRPCADKYGILPHIGYNANVVASRFDEGTSTWVVSTFLHRQAASSFKLADQSSKPNKNP